MRNTIEFKNENKTNNNYLNSKRLLNAPKVEYLSLNLNENDNQISKFKLSNIDKNVLKNNALNLKKLESFNHNRNQSSDTSFSNSNSTNNCSIEASPLTINTVMLNSSENNNYSCLHMFNNICYSDINKTIKINDINKKESNVLEQIKYKWINNIESDQIAKYYKNSYNFKSRSNPDNANSCYNLQKGLIYQELLINSRSNQFEGNKMIKYLR